jgi:hypothetical protein
MPRPLTGKLQFWLLALRLCVSPANPSHTRVVKHSIQGVRWDADGEGDAMAERNRFWRFWFRGELLGFLHRHPLLVFGALVLLVTLLLPTSPPEWDRQVITFLWAHPLFLGAAGLGLLCVLV